MRSDKNCKYSVTKVSNHELKYPVNLLIIVAIFLIRKQTRVEGDIE